ncbi:hypothetical protein Hanom_Chr14g01328101 [Helianthus anomalus]
MIGGSKTYIPKNFYRTGGSKTYIPKNFYTKTRYITLLCEKFGGSGAPPRPFYPSPIIHPKSSIESNNIYNKQEKVKNKLKLNIQSIYMIYRTYKYKP